MKKNNHNGEPMSGLAVITTVKDPWLIKAFVEKRVVNQAGQYYSARGLQKGLVPVATASTEVLVSGGLLLSGRKQSISTPFKGVFLFTCIKTPHSLFSLEWGVSLS